MFSQWEIQIQRLAERASTQERNRGAIALEYGLLLMLVAFVAITGLAIFGGLVVEMYSDTADRFSLVTSGAFD